jgi:hypothetical protein
MAALIPADIFEDWGPSIPPGDSSAGQALGQAPDRPDAQGPMSALSVGKRGPRDSVPGPRVLLGAFPLAVLLLSGPYSAWWRKRHRRSATS